MNITPLPLEGVFLLESTANVDERGWFSRLYCEETLKSAGIDFSISQINASYNSHRGTLRGLHFQEHPHEEAKIVRCVRGGVFDVLVDIRPESPTFSKWHAVELSAENRISIYIPEGYAHGFQTLEDGCELLYLMNKPYHPGASNGLRFDEPSLGIPWPLPVAMISERDLAFGQLNHSIGRACRNLTNSSHVHQRSTL
jgi:dTDP-4-dehydrorhamnose 3,5-epimerase